MDDTPAFDHALRFVQGGLYHELIKRRPQQIGCLLQSGLHVLRHPGRDSAAFLSRQSHVSRQRLGNEDSSKLHPNRVVTECHLLYHSCLMPAALPTLAQRSVSLLMNAANSAGPSPATSNPTSCSCLRVSGELSGLLSTA